LKLPIEHFRFKQKGLSAKGKGNNTDTPAYYKEQVMSYADEDFNRYTRDYSRNNPNEREAIQKEHMDRISQGVEAWNEFDAAFAEYIKQHYISDPYYDFEGAIFSEDANFCKATFSGDPTFYKAIFSGDAIFYKATFSGGAIFNKATFSEDAYFGEATFSGIVDFRGATFSGDAIFYKATFSEDATFYKAIFSEDAYFGEATFSGIVNFPGATFSGDAYFERATFSGDAHFQWAKFKSSPIFRGINSKSLLNFSNVKATNAVPIFEGIDYKVPPIIDGLSLPKPKNNKLTSDIDFYRQLKMIAIAGANHEKEVEFFGYETQCKLYLDHTPWPSKALIGSYLFFSDFGQSILRPILSLFFVFLVACSSTHITVESGRGPIACENAKNTGAFESKSDAAWSQSIDFILPILKADRGTLRQRNQCLYGHDGVPRINRLINGAQQIVSLVFLFLAGLAIRNRFKIK